MEYVKTSLNNQTVKVALSKDYRVLRAIYLPTLELKTVDVAFLYNNPMLEMPYKNSKDFERLFLGMFPGSTEVVYTPAALNAVMGLADLNSKDQTPLLETQSDFSN